MSAALDTWGVAHDDDIPLPPEPPADPWEIRPAMPPQPPIPLKAASEPDPEPVLVFQTIADLCAEVDAAGPRRWLIRGIWPAGAYGVHAAEPKAGKTWNALDLAVSVASGTPWLGQHPIDTAGPVVVFAGEGGKGNVVRRLRAIATHRGVELETLPITVCTRAPHLGDDAHMGLLERHLRGVMPVLAILDPFYLAAGGANGADLYAMGKLLERPQLLCEATGAALIVVTHFNRSRDLKGAARITGAGPAEWGRVLISASVVSRSTSDDLATTVLTELDIQGGEVPDRSIRVRRVIRADDPDDLDSPLTYSVDEPDHASQGDYSPSSSPSGTPGVGPAATKLLEALDAQTDPAPIADLVDHVVATHGHGLKRPTCSTELNKLRGLDLADYLDAGPGKERLWYRIRKDNAA